MSLRSACGFPSDPGAPPGGGIAPGERLNPGTKGRLVPIVNRRGSGPRPGGAPERRQIALSVPS